MLRGLSGHLSIAPLKRPHRLQRRLDHFLILLRRDLALLRYCFGVREQRHEQAQFVYWTAQRHAAPFLEDPAPAIADLIPEFFRACVVLVGRCEVRVARYERPTYGRDGSGSRNCVSTALRLFSSCTHPSAMTVWRFVPAST